MVWGFYCAIMLYDYSVSTNEGNNNLGFFSTKKYNKSNIKSVVDDNTLIGDDFHQKQDE